VVDVADGADVQVLLGAGVNIVVAGGGGPRGGERTTPAGGDPVGAERKKVRGGGEDRGETNVRRVQSAGRGGNGGWRGERGGRGVPWRRGHGATVAERTSSAGSMPARFATSLADAGNPLTKMHHIVGDEVSGSLGGRTRCTPGRRRSAPPS